MSAGAWVPRPGGEPPLPESYRPPARPVWLAEQARPGEQAFDALVRGWLLGFASADTRESYERDIAAWRAFLGTSVDPLLADRSHVDAFARALEVAQYAARTRRRRISAVSSLYEYAIERGARRGENPARYTARPPVPTGRRRHLSQGQAVALLETAAASGHEHRLRDGVILRLFLYLGLRVSEVCKLNLRDYDRSTEQLVVRGKGGAEVRLELPPELLAAIEAYLPHRSPPAVMAAAADDAAALEAAHPGGRGRGMEPLFYLHRPHLRGRKPSRGSRITPDSITSRLREIAKDAALPAALATALTPHDLRHTMLTLLSRRAPFAEVQRTGRHKRAETTMLYLHPDPDGTGSHVLARILEPEQAHRHLPRGPG